jgi:hypothetical protein
VSEITRRRLLLAFAAAPLAIGLSRLPAASSMTVGEAIAWLHRVGLRTPREQG